MNLSIFEQARICSALALKNIQASLMFLARLSIFLEGVKFTACPIFICCKIIVPLWIETRTAYKWVINVRIHLYAVCLFIYIFVSRSFPLPSAFLSTGIERTKVFGLNTLRRRKILSETACRPDLSTFKG